MRSIVVASERNPRTPTHAKSAPPTPPRSARTTLSVSSCRTMPAATSADREPNRHLTLRVAVRARNRFATLTQAMSSTNATAPQDEQRRLDRLDDRVLHRLETPFGRRRLGPHRPHERAELRGRSLERHVIGQAGDELTTSLRRPPHGNPELHLRIREGKPARHYPDDGEGLRRRARPGNRLSERLSAWPMMPGSPWK